MTNRKIVIAMTSWRKRINYCIDVITSLENNTIQPDIIYLTLSEEEFPGKEKDLPENLVQHSIDSDIFTINWVKPNHKTFKKVFPVLGFLDPNDIVIDMDDDVIVPSDFIESRLRDFCKYDGKYCITTNQSMTQHGMRIISVGSLFVVKFLSNHEKFLSDAVIRTYNDDRTYAFLMHLNGFSAKPCSNYIYGKDNTGKTRIRFNTLPKETQCKMERSYDNIVIPDLRRRFGFVFSKNAFGYWRNSSVEQDLSVEDILERINNIQKDESVAESIKSYSVGQTTNNVKPRILKTRKKNYYTDNY